MHLQEHARPETSGPEAIVQPHHGDLHDVGRTALDGRVDGGALYRHPLVHRQAAVEQLREEALAALQRLHVAVPACLGQGAVDVLADARVRAEVLLQELLGLPLGKLRAAAEAERADAVDRGEVDGLPQPALLACHLVDGHAEELRGGDGVDVLVRLECRNQ